MGDEVELEHHIGVELRPGGVDQLLAELAGRQHGVAARWQLLKLGVSRREIERRLEAGRLHAVHRGVYAVGHRVLSQRGYWMAAVLAGGPGAVLSHRSAGGLWVIRADNRACSEITVPRKRPSRPGIDVRHSRLPADERTVLHGIPVTTVPRTLLDLASVVNRRQVERAWHEAEVLRLWDELSVPDLLARHPRRRGAATIRAVLAAELEGVAVTRNEFEEEMLAFVVRTGLPQPEMNAVLEVSGHSFEVDCVWRAERLAVELDSYGVHGTRRKFESDRARDRILQAAGWRTARITWRQLTEEPATVERDLRTLLRR